MPIEPWRILAAKTLMGVVLCVGPLLVAAIVSWLVAGGREIYLSSIFDFYGRSTVAALLLFFWMMALTSRLPSEARAGLVAVGILICWMLGTGLAPPDAPRLLLAASPLAFLRSWFSASENGLPLFVAPLLQVVIVVVLWTSTLKLFGVSSDRES